MLLIIFVLPVYVEAAEVGSCACEYTELSGVYNPSGKFSENDCANIAQTPQGDAVVCQWTPDSPVAEEEQSLPEPTVTPVTPPAPSAPSTPPTSQNPSTPQPAKGGATPGISGEVTHVNLKNPISSPSSGKSGVTDIKVLFGRILQQALAVIGSLALLMFIIGGAYWLISAGNAERVKKGTETMLWAVIGLFVVFGAYGIVGTVITGLTGKSLDQVQAPPAIPDGETTPVTIVYYSFEGENVPIRKDAVGTSPSVSLKALSGVINCLAGSDQHLFGYTRVEDPNNKGSFGWVEDKYLKQNASCGIKKLPASNDAYAPKSASATACGCYGSVEIKTKGLASLLVGDCTMSIDKTNKVQIPYGTKTNSQNVLKLVLEKGPQDCRDLIKHLDKLPNTDLTVDAYGCEQALPNILSQYSQYKSDFADVAHTLTCEPL